MILFTINKNAFLANLRIVKQAIASRVAIPVLSKIKIAVAEEGITLTAANGQISIEKFIPAADKDAGMMISQTGSILLESNQFESIVNSIPEVTFTFEEIEHFQVKLTSGKYEATIKGQDAELYPRIQEISSKVSTKISVGTLKELFNETAFAVSTQESRPILTGVHLILFEHQNLLSVATDSHRLSQRIIKLETISEDFDVVLPNKSIASFRSVFTDDEETVSIYLSSTQLLFKTENVNFYTRLLEGNYPETDRLIPEDSLYSLDLIFDAADLLHAMSRAKLLVNASNNGTVKLIIDDDSVISTVNSPEIGSSHEELSTLARQGENLSISFNPQYLIDALKVVKEPEVRIRFISPVRPFTLVPKNDGSDFIQLITPVRTN